jgi:hypothetical protein
LARLNEGQTPQQIAEETEFTFAKILRMKREFDSGDAEDSAASNLGTHIGSSGAKGGTVKYTDLVEAAAHHAGVNTDLTNEVFGSTQSSLEKCLEGTALTVLSRISQVAAFTDLIEPAELGILAAATAKLRDAFTTKEEKPQLLQAEVGLSQFADLMRD